MNLLNGVIKVHINLLFEVITLTYRALLVVSGDDVVFTNDAQSLRDLTAHRTHHQGLQARPYPYQDRLRL